MIRTPLRRAVVAAAAASALALTLAACSGAAEAGQSDGGVDAASATDVSAFGSFEALQSSSTVLEKPAPAAIFKAVFPPGVVWSGARNQFLYLSRPGATTIFTTYA